MAKENFNAIFEALTNPNLSNEGTKWFPGDKNDPNPTQSGITQNAYNRYLKRNDLPITSVRGISDEQRAAITREDYWNKIGGDQLPSGLDYQALDIAFNAGVPRAAYLMKQALGLPLIGTSSANEPWTNDIVAAAQGLQGNDLQGAISKFTDARHDLYGSFKQADTFPGWFTRADNVGNAALRLAKQGAIAITGDVPLPPSRPDDGSNGITPRPSEVVQGLNNFSDTITQGLADGFSALTGRIPTAQEFQGRLNDVASGTRSLFDQLTDIAGSPEAKTFAQATGIDPSQYVLNDIYRLGLGRDVDAPSALSQLEVLRNQGGQSLYNQLANSQEGRTYALGNLYENGLGRGIDQGGLGKWLSDLAAGKSMQAVQTEVLSSPEAQARGITPDQFASLIGPSYSSTIGPNGFATPVGPGSTGGTIGPGPTQGTIGPNGTQSTIGPGPTQGTVGGTGTEVRPVGPEGYETSVVGAPEASQTVRGIYDEILARAPDEQGAVGFQGQIQRGVSPSIVEAQVLASPEAKALPPDRYQGLVQNYQTKYGLMPEEVQTLGPLAEEFAKVLGRPADTKTLQYWDQELDAGTPQSILEARVLTAPETQAVGAPALSKLVNDYQTQYALKPEEVATLGPLASEFAKVVGRPVDTPTLQYWDQQIDAGRSLPELNAQVLTAPETLARTGGVGDAYTAFQSQYGRSPSDYLAALSNPYGFSGANVSGNVGNGSFAGTFDPSQYLAANPDVAAAGANPLAHFIQFGLSEGRAVDTAGHHLPQNFDSTAYLAQNQDVARSGMNPLEHYLRYGASEGRAAPTGQNPYSFTTANVSQGAGPIGNGTFSGTFNGADYLAANRDVAASGMDPLSHYLQFGFNEGRAIDTRGDIINKGFDPLRYLNLNQDVKAAGMDPLRHYLMSGASEGRALPTGSNPYSFSNFNVASALGAGPQTFGSYYPVGDAPSSGGGGNVSDPFGFSGANVGGYDANAGAAAPAPMASLPESGGLGYNSRAGERSYLQGQALQNNQQIIAGQSPFATNPNLWGANQLQQANALMQQNFAPVQITPYSNAQQAALNTFTPPPALIAPVMPAGPIINPIAGSTFHLGGW